MLLIIINGHGIPYNGIQPRIETSHYLLNSIAIQPNDKHILAPLVERNINVSLKSVIIIINDYVLKIIIYNLILRRRREIYLGFKWVTHLK